MDLNSTYKVSWMLYGLIESTPNVDVNPDVIFGWLNDIKRAEEQAINDCLHKDWPNKFPQTGED